MLSAIFVFNARTAAILSNYNTVFSLKESLLVFYLLYSGIKVTSVYFFSRMLQKRFKQVVDSLLQFISLRMFPAKPEELPLLEKCTWWIPSATKVLSLFSRFPKMKLIFVISSNSVYAFLTIQYSLF